MSELTALVVNFRSPDMLERCLASLEPGRAAGEYGVVVVENGSGDESASVVRERFPDARLIALDENLGFAGGVTRGLEDIDSEWVALVNNDAEVERTTLSQCLDAARSDPAVGMVTPQVRFFAEPETINSAGLEIDRLGVGYDRSSGQASDPPAPPLEVFGVSGCVALYRQSMVEAVGGFDSSFFAYLEDADLAWRARAAGWRALYVPGAVCHHHASVTARERSAFKYFLVGRNRMRMLAKNAMTGQLLRYGLGMLAYDLAYVVYVAASDRTLAPLRGRVAGLREWRAYRRAGAPTRRPAPLLPAAAGWRGALRQRKAYDRGGTKLD